MLADSSKHRHHMSQVQLSYSSLYHVQTYISMFSKGHYPQNAHPYKSMTCFYLGINPFNWDSNPWKKQLEIFSASCFPQVFISWFLLRAAPQSERQNHYCIIKHVQATLLVPTAVVEHMPCQEHILHEFLDAIRVPLMFDMFDGLTWLIQHKWMTGNTEAMSQHVTVMLWSQTGTLFGTKMPSVPEGVQDFPIMSSVSRWFV